MTSTESFAAGSLGIFGILLIIFGIAYSILMIALPFIVYGILRQARLTNKILDHIAQLNDFAEREAATRATAAAYQSELIVAALQRIKDSGDSILTHAQYQTEVTRQRLALETAAADSQTT